MTKHEFTGNCYLILGQICATSDKDGEGNPDSKDNEVDVTSGKTNDL